MWVSCLIQFTPVHLLGLITLNMFRFYLRIEAGHSSLKAKNDRNHIGLELKFSGLKANWIHKK